MYPKLSNMCRSYVVHSGRISKVFRRLLVPIVLILCIFFIRYYYGYRCWEPLEEISCHYNITTGDLPPFEKSMMFADIKSSNTEKEDTVNHESKTRNIFFHETSCRGDLTPRQACTVESAAKAHPNWTIFVLFSGPVSEESIQNGDSVVSTIKSPNVKFWRLYIATYVKHTSLEFVVSSGALGRSCYRISHTSDVLRFTTLLKHPGVYLDLDIIVSRALDGLGRNFVIRESDTAVAAGILAFGDDHLGRQLARTVAEEVSETFNGVDFGYNGPGAITRVLQRWCSTPHVAEMNEATCKGMRVYGPKIAYPVHWKEAKTYFEPGRLPPHIETHAYMYHVWGTFSRGFTSKEDSPYHELARKYCPDAYKAFRSEFGWKQT